MKKNYFLFIALILVFIFSSCTSASETILNNKSTDVVPITDLKVDETQIPTTVEKPTEVKQTYAYDNLYNDISKEIYKKVDEAVKNNTPQEINCECYADESQIFEVLEAYKNDNPEVFWLKGEFTYSVSDNVTFIELAYNISGEELSKAKNEFNNKLNEIVNSVPYYANDIDRELYVFDYIINNSKYGYDSNIANKDEAIDLVNNTYSTLVDKITVCAGYSRTFQLLCNKVGIECVCISGTAAGENHMWNCVKIDNKWYQTDVTWSHPDNAHCLYSSDKYNYFNITDEMMYEEHTLFDYYYEGTDAKNCINFYVPKCTDTDKTYYNAKCEKLMDLNNSNRIVSAMALAARSKEKAFAIVIDDSLDYERTVSKISFDGIFEEWAEKANSINQNNPQISTFSPTHNVEKFNALICDLKYIE